MAWQQYTARGQQGAVNGAQQAAWAHGAAPPAVRPPVTYGAAAAAAAPETFTVSCVGPDAQDVVIKTILGEFVHHGENHGRKTYKRIASGSNTSMEVFLYYWNETDGPDYQGWWFGSLVGGTQVWSHNASSAIIPPAMGWKVPWDGQVRPSVRITKTVAVAAPAAPAPVAPPAFTPKPQPPIVSAGRFGHPATAAHTPAGPSKVAAEARSQFEAAHQLLGDYSNPTTVARVEEQLQRQVQEVTATIRTTMEAMRGAPVNAIKESQQTVAELRNVISLVNAELNKVRLQKGKAEQMAKQQELAAQDQATAEELVTSAADKADLAEDAVEKAAINSEMIEAAGDDQEDLNRALTDTENAALEASKVLGEARVFVNSRLASARRLLLIAIRDETVSKIEAIQLRMVEAQNRLQPIRLCRQEHEEKVEANLVIDKVFQTLSYVDNDIAQAESLSGELTAESSKSAKDEVTAAIDKADEAITAASKFITRKKGNDQESLVFKEVGKTEARITAARQRVADLKTSRKAAVEKDLSVTVVKTAQRKVNDFEAALKVASEAECPFLLGVDDLPKAEMDKAVKSCDTAVSAANSAMSAAKMNIASTLVEVRRWNKEVGEATSAKLNELKVSIETHAKTLAEFKERVLARRSESFYRDVDAAASAAEAACKELAAAADVFKSVEDMLSWSEEDLKAKRDESLAADKTISKSATESKHLLGARQVELRGKDDTAMKEFSSKLQARLQAIQAEQTASKKILAGVEARLMLKKTLGDLGSRVATGENRVAELKIIVAGLDAPPAEGEVESPAEERSKAAEALAETANSGLKSAVKLLEMHARRNLDRSDLFDSLRTRIDESQKTLDELSAPLKERTEQFTVSSIVQEATSKLEEAETRVKELEECQAELDRTEEASNEECVAILVSVDSAIKSATASASSAKSVIAMKRLAAKRLREKLKDSVTETLMKLLERLEPISTQLAATKESLVDARAPVIKRQVTYVVEGAIAAVAAFEQVVNEAPAADAEITENELNEVCNKTADAKDVAQKAMSTARDILQNRLKEMKAEQSKVCSEVADHIDAENAKMPGNRKTFDKLVTQFKEREMAFTAIKLEAKCIALVESIEQQKKAAAEIINPVVGESALAAMGSVQELMAVVRKYVVAEGKAISDIYAEIGGSAAAHISEEQFLAYVAKAVDKVKVEGREFSVEEQQEVFKHLADAETHAVSEEALLEQLRTRYTVEVAVSMIETFELGTDPKTVRKLQVEEVVEALEEPAKVGKLLRVKVRAEKDNAEGFATVSNENGSVFLAPCSAFAAKKQAVLDAASKLDTAAKEAVEKLVRKCNDDLRFANEPAFKEVRLTIAKLKPRVRESQAFAQDATKKAQNIETSITQAVEAVKRRRQEAVERAEADAVLAEVDALATAATDVADKAVPELEKAVFSLEQGESEFHGSVTILDGDAIGISALVKKVLDCIEGHLAGVPSSEKGVKLELRTALLKTRHAMKAIDLKTLRLQRKLTAAHTKLVDDSYAKCAAFVRQHARGAQLGASDLVAQLRGDDGLITCDAIKAFVAKQDNSPYETTLTLGFARFSTGLADLDILAMLEEYKSCVKDIAMTNGVEIAKTSKTVRKLAMGEVVYVYEYNTGDTGIERIRARALKDGAEGWVSVKSNQGTEFLESCPKPYYQCNATVSLDAEMEPSEAQGTEVQPGEVLDILQGPQRAASTVVHRLKGKPAKDGKEAKVGWVTLTSASGAELLKKAPEVFQCKAVVVATDNLDIKGGKTVRKLVVGELLKVIGEEQTDANTTLVRRQVKALSDDIEGWVTVKGNGGKVFIAPAEQVYEVVESVPVEADRAVGGESDRRLEVGELFEAEDAPVKDTTLGAKRYKVRVVAPSSESAEGWFSFTDEAVSTWVPRYRCEASSEMQEAVDPASATVRTLEAGERLRAIGAPEKHPASGAVRQRVATGADAKVGFVSFRNAEGLAVLKSSLE